MKLYEVCDLERWMRKKFKYYTLFSLKFAGRCNEMALQMETLLQVPVEKEITLKI